MHAMSLTDLADLASRIRNEDPSIASTFLPADGRLQVRDTHLDAVCKEVVQHMSRAFRGLRESDFPMHYCAWGKARVGSTALNNLFGLAGFPSYYQPVKSMLRTLFFGANPEPWFLPNAEAHPYIFTKETQGPNSLGECLFIPLQMLIEAGYPPSKLHLIVLERDPERSLASWLNKFTPLQTPEKLVQFHVLAALNANRVRRYAREQTVPVTHYIYEASQEPLIAGRALFARLGLSRFFSETAVTDWGERGRLDSETSHRIIYPAQPEMYNLPGLHSSDRGYRYRNGTGSISESQRSLLRANGVYEMYEDAVKACIADLGLDARTAARLFRADHNSAAAPRDDGMADANIAAGINELATTGA